MFIENVWFAWQSWFWMLKPNETWPWIWTGILPITLKVQAGACRKSVTSTTDSITSPLHRYIVPRLSNPSRSILWLQAAAVRPDEGQQAGDALHLWPVHRRLGLQGLLVHRRQPARPHRAPNPTQPLGRPCHRYPVLLGRLLVAPSATMNCWKRGNRWELGFRSQHSKV